MCETVGEFCSAAGRESGVWYKTQKTNPALDEEGLELKKIYIDSDIDPSSSSSSYVLETPFLRAARIIKNFKAAVDSQMPGFHCTSGSDAYVQVTSPIRSPKITNIIRPVLYALNPLCNRRYHDLYNHFRLKGLLHAASMSPEWADRAKLEAGFSVEHIPFLSVYVCVSLKSDIQ